MEIWDEDWHFTGACEPDPKGLDRGWYSGPIGWTDAAGDGEFCVALRCALLLTLDNSEPRYTLEFFPLLIVWGSFLFSAKTTIRRATR